MNPRRGGIEWLTECIPMCDGMNTKGRFFIHLKALLIGEVFREIFPYGCHLTRVYNI